MFCLSICFVFFILFIYLFIEVSEDIIHIVLMLEVLFIQDFKAEDMFCCVPSGSESGLFFAIISSVWGLSLFKMTFS